MVNQIELRKGFKTIGTLYSNKPISKRDLKKAGATQSRVGGPWHVYQAQADELKGLGYNLTDTPPTRGDWHDDPATSAQRAYLTGLGVKPEQGMTKGRASQLIDTHNRDGSIGSIGGWYLDGSN